MSKSVSVCRNDLLPALSFATQIVEKRNTIPILSSVLLRAANGQLSITATDLDMEAHSACACEGEASIATTLAASNLHDILRKLPDGCMVKLEGEDKGWTISSGRASFKLPCLPADDFPLMSIGEYDHSFSIPAQHLKTMLEGVRHAISVEETRYYLNGAYLHPAPDHSEMIAVATDGHRLARIPVELPEGAADFTPGILPRKALGVFLKALPDAGDVQLSIAAGRIQLEIENGPTITTKLIDGTFPDYVRVIPRENGNHYLVDRVALQNAVDRVITISGDKGRAIRLICTDGEIRLEANNPDAGTGEETIEAERQSGDDVTIGFNGKYCLDLMQSLSCEKLIIELGDAGAPALVRPVTNADHEPSFVLMPMRI